MKKLTLLIIASSLILTTNLFAGSGNLTIGGGAIGNFFIVDSRPELNPGAGGLLYLDYRWAPQLSTTITLLLTTENGTGANSGDNHILFLGIPTFDFKFYFLTEASHWDPYVHMGIGIYAITEGSQDNGTVAVGMGADIGTGFDYYFNRQFSAGLGLQFRSVGLIDNVKGPGNGLFPLSLTGSLAFHF